MHAASALPAELTIYGAGELRAALLERLAAEAADAAGPFALDASGVAEVDAAGVQLLVALARSLAERGRALRLDEPSAALVAACEALGLAALVAPPAAEAA